MGEEIILIGLTLSEALDYVERVRHEHIGSCERLDPLSIVSDRIEKALNNKGIVLPDRVVS